MSALIPDVIILDLESDSEADCAEQEAADAKVEAKQVVQEAMVKAEKAQAVKDMQEACQKEKQQLMDEKAK